MSSLINVDPLRSRDPDAEYHSGAYDIISELQQTERGQRWYRRLSENGISNADINTFFFTLDKVLGCKPILCLRLKDFKTKEVSEAIERYLRSRNEPVKQKSSKGGSWRQAARHSSDNIQRMNKPSVEKPATAEISSCEEVMRLLEESHEGKELRDHIEDSFEPEGVCEWLFAPSRYLKGQTPAEVILEGDLVSVEAALEALDSGIFI